MLVLCPTRELAVQCEAVGRALAEKGGMDVRFALLVGGLSLSAQAHTLRTLPDILIATPGRLIDHLTNTPSFTLSALDVLVIDEADRMLEAGFTDELEEIIKACPRSRQTMLFSATMTDKVDELVKLSLDRPIRVFVDPKRSTASGLTQEFVRVRSDDSRFPTLLALCKRTVRERCIIFFRSKALAHQMRVVFGLCGLKAAELHGNLTQEQVSGNYRTKLIAASERFERFQGQQGRLPPCYRPRVPRTRYQRSGDSHKLRHARTIGAIYSSCRSYRSCRSQRTVSGDRLFWTGTQLTIVSSISLVGEADRKMLKAAIKQAEIGQIRHRIIPAEALASMSAQLDGLKVEAQEVLNEEREEKMVRQCGSPWLTVRFGKRTWKSERDRTWSSMKQRSSRGRREHGFRARRKSRLLRVRSHPYAVSG